MPKGRSSVSKSRRSTFEVVLLLVKFFLISIGYTPIFIVRGSWFIVHRLVSWLLQLRLPNFSLFTLALSKVEVFHFSLSKRPGRPRKSSVFSLYRRRVAIFIKRMPKQVKVSAALGIFLLFFISYTYFALRAAYTLPSPAHLSSSDHPLTTEFYDRNGVLLYRLYEGRNRSLVNIDDLPPYLTQATIAIEDRNFYHHPGVDPLAILRALRNNLSNISVQGGSTITQQLIKNTILNSEKSYSRKIKEILLAFWAERIYSKKEILQMYLNESPYGGPAWGVEAGALTYFGKSAKDLNLAESAFLAGLPASPTEYSPYGSHPELALKRQQQVLKRMVEDRYISLNQAQDALSQPLNIKDGNQAIYAPHFVMYVKDLLSQRYGNKLISQGGLKVYTSLDLGLQTQVQAIVASEVERLVPLQVSNGAAMITDAQTGQILAMVGSKDYNVVGFGNYNVALSLRQPGSSIKPATYATAFKQGLTPGNTILDIPVRFGEYAPINYDGRFHGPVSLRTALGSSYNIPAVKLLAMVGIDQMIQTAKDLGITTFDDPKRYGLSLTLGGGEVKMIDMMTMYGTLSQMGIKHPTAPILKIVDSQGNIIEEYKDDSERVLQEEIAYLITNILADNKARAPAFGPQSLLNIPGHQVAVKTGTSDNKRDNWTFGYTPEFVIGVWVGNNNNAPMHPTLTSGVTGAAPIWNKIVKGLLASREPVAFKRPAGVIDALIDGRKDLAVAGILPKNLVRIKPAGDKTTFFDAFSSYATSSAITSLRESAN